VTAAGSGETFGCTRHQCVEPAKLFVLFGDLGPAQLDGRLGGREQLGRPAVVGSGESDSLGRASDQRLDPGNDVWLVHEQLRDLFESFEARGRRGTVGMRCPQPLLELIRVLARFFEPSFGRSGRFGGTVELRLEASDVTLGLLDGLLVV
jgi:hypothetical protein